MAPSGAAVAAPIAASARDAEIRITLFYKVQQCNTYVSNRHIVRTDPCQRHEAASDVLLEPTFATDGVHSEK